MLIKTYFSRVGCLEEKFLYLHLILATITSRWNLFQIAQITINNQVYRRRSAFEDGVDRQRPQSMFEPRSGGKFNFGEAEVESHLDIFVFPHLLFSGWEVPSKPAPSLLGAFRIGHGILVQVGKTICSQSSNWQFSDLKGLKVWNGQSDSQCPSQLPTWYQREPGLSQGNFKEGACPLLLHHLAHPASTTSAPLTPPASPPGQPQHPVWLLSLQSLQSNLLRAPPTLRPRSWVQ